jgi:hypothetical protein
MSYSGKKWTTDEINKSVELFRKGKDYSYISKKLDSRSEYAVQCKMESYVFDKIGNGMSYETLSKDLNRTEEDLKNMYTSQFKRNPAKGNNINSSKIESITSTSLNFIPSPNNMYGIINRIVSPYIEFHENLEKLEKLSSNETISKKTYKKICNILELSEIGITDDKFLEQLKKTVETKRIVPVKSDSKTDESDETSEDEIEDEKVKEKNKKMSSEKNDFPRKRIL